MVCQGDVMDIDLPTEHGPTEETVEALMDYLVGPLLPLKLSDIAKDAPSESQQKSVAKQVHAAAVLYNYYHRNHHRESEFLKFDQFCCLAIMFKPSILHHMKYMSKSDRSVLDDPEKQLSLAEKAIMDACTISETLLDATTNVLSMIKEWPISKVAVLLIDSKKENCFLQFNDGVWSLIEKDLYFVKEKGKKRLWKYDEDGEVEFQKLAFTAVKEATGIGYGKLKILESHVVYSLSQAKTSTRFYIVQSTQSIISDNLVPIQDAICSVQGPVVKKSSGSWVITPVVEYYYLLPYAEIISKLSSRVSNSIPHQVEKGSADLSTIQSSQKSCEKGTGESKKLSDNLIIKSNLDAGSVHNSNSSKEEAHDRNVALKCVHPNNYSVPISEVLDDVGTSKLIGKPFNQKVKETEKSVGNKNTGANGDSMKQKDMNGFCKAESNNSSSGANSKGIDKPLKVYHHQKRTTSTKAISIKENLKDTKKMSTISQMKDEKVDGEKNSFTVLCNEDKILTVDHALEDIHLTVDAKSSELSEAALRALLHKRRKLCDQQRNIEGELTLCDKKIQAIMRAADGDCLGLKLEAVLDCCNEICQQDNMQAQEHTNMHGDRSLALSGKSLSEAQLTLRKACQELEDICLSNSWTLPSYHTTCSNGMYVANVTVKGLNFECSGVGGLQPSMHEARNSAATHLITKLQQMAGELNTALP